MDTVEDDSEADVLDEEDDDCNHGWNNQDVSWLDEDEVENHGEDEDVDEDVAECQVGSKKFIVLDSYSMNFHAGHYQIDYRTNDENDVRLMIFFMSDVNLMIFYIILWIDNDRSNGSNDLQGTSHVAINLPYSLNAVDVFDVCFVEEEAPQNEVRDHEELKWSQCWSLNGIVNTSSYSNDGNNNSKHG